MILTRLQRALVRILAPRDDATGIVADLDEEAADRAAEHGPRTARRWVRWQIAHSAAPWLARRTGERLRTLHGGMTMMRRGWWTDVRLASRRLLHARGFTTLAVLTLAIGIGAVSTVFSLAYALWLKPLPYGDPARLVTIAVRHEPSGTTSSLTAPELAGYQRSASSFASVAGFIYGAGITKVNGEPVRVASHFVSANLFRVLGVRPSIGRDFVDGDADAGTRAVMLSHAWWVKHFGSNPAVVGSMMPLHGIDHRIAGVMPRGFTFPRGLEADVWIPSDFSKVGAIDRHVQAIARLAPGRTISEAESEGESLMRAVTMPSDGNTGRWRALVVSADVTASRDGRVAFQSLLGLVGVFLAIACTNLAGLMLARNSARKKEIALCLSLGASRLRLARTLFIESLLIALAGCSAGVLLASYGASALSAVLPPRTPGLEDIGLNMPVVTLAVLASAASSVLIGLLPALSLRSMRPADALSGSRTVAAGASLSQRGVVVAEIALALVLIVGAAVMWRAFTGLLARDRGYDPQGLVALNVSLPFTDDSYLPTETRARFFDDVLARVGAVPSVRSAAATTGFPGSPLGILGSVPITPPDGAKPLLAGLHAASPAYFETLGTPIVAGRAFARTDTTHAAKVAIVNATLAREYPGGNPIGHRVTVRVPGGAPGGELFEIVGVAGDIRLGERAGHRIFVPLAQGSAYWVDLVVRATAGEAVLGPIRQALRAINPDLLLENDSSFQRIISNSVALQRTQSTFAILTGSLAVLLAGVGLYALMSFVAAQRRRELSVRLAIGAPPLRLFRDAVFAALRLAIAGVVIGEIASLLVVRALSGVVFGLSSVSVSAYVFAGLVVLVVALAAAAIPARRVLRLDPLLALRE